MGYLDAGGLSHFWEIIRTALLGKQDKLTPDESITLTDGSIGVKTPVNGVLTQEEYDALPEAQKAKGVYIVPGNGAAASGLSNIYSTEETVIGRWIDGKPVYRRVIITQTADRNIMDGTDIKIAELDGDVDSVISLSGIIARADGSMTPVPNSMFSKDFGPLTFWLRLYNKRDIMEAHNYPSGYNHVPLYIFIEYTKASDAPQNSTSAAASTQSANKSDEGESA